MKRHWHIRSTPSSAIFFEFFDNIDQKTKKTVNSFVKFLYYDGSTKSFEYLKLNNVLYMQWTDFLKFINDNLSAVPFTSVKEMCQNTSIQVPNAKDYYSSSLVLNDFFTKYPLIAKNTNLFLE